MHSPSHTARQTFILQRWITLAGVALLMIKFMAYYLTNSVAILTDALESIVNVVAGLVSLYSLYVAAKPRDADHPYGHGKAELLSAGVEGTLIVLAGVWMMVEAVSKMLHPSPVQHLDLGILLIAISGLLNYLIGMLAERTGRRNKSLAITATGKHLKSDAWSTAGLIAGLTLMYFSNLPWLDSVVALLFAIIIIYTGVGIVRKSIAGIMDEADTVLLQQLVAMLNRERRNNWIDLHNLRIIKYGNALHVDCHLTIPWYMNVHEAHQEIDHLDRLIRHDFGSSLEMFVHTDGCLPFSCKVCQVEGCAVRKSPFHRRVDWTLENIIENKKHGLETG
jgi:cation diffusion facilitator family transporter